MSKTFRWETCNEKESGAKLSTADTDSAHWSMNYGRLLFDFLNQIQEFQYQQNCCDCDQNMYPATEPGCPRKPSVAKRAKQPEYNQYDDDGPHISHSPFNEK